MSKELVLVTGATGHLGFRTLVFSLQHGFKARVALRKLQQAEKLKDTASLKPHLDNVEFVHVPDITADGAYDEAIKGVDYVIHVASPIYSGFGADQTDWKTLMYDPAEKGAISILSAATKESHVKRVVITSSVVVIEPKNGAARAGPQDVKAIPPQSVLDNAVNAPMAYVMSKVLAHVRSTEYVEKNNVHYDLIRVLPGYIQGANELYSSAEEMRDHTKLGSNEGTMLTALGTTMGTPRPGQQIFLDDAAKAHVIALEADSIKNLDNIIAVGSGGVTSSWTDIAGVVEKLFPEEVKKKGVLKPKTTGDEGVGDVDVASSEEKLGFKFAGPETYVKSVVGQYLTFLEH